MTANPNTILAGVGAGGPAGVDLCWVAPLGSTGPTDGTTALDAAFKSPGYVTTDGLTRGVQRNNNQVNAYGTNVPVRTIRTTETRTFGVTFLETNPLTLALYHQKPLTGAGALSATAAGEIAYTTGQAETILFAAVFLIVDGLNLIRIYAPSCEVTDTADQQFGAGNAILYPVTITAYPGSDGAATQEWAIVDALKTA